MIIFETTAEFKAAIKSVLEEELSISVWVTHDSFEDRLSVETKVFFMGEEVASDIGSDYIPRGDSQCQY